MIFSDKNFQSLLSTIANGTKKSILEDSVFILKDKLFITDLDVSVIVPINWGIDKEIAVSASKLLPLLPQLKTAKLDKAQLKIKNKKSSFTLAIKDILSPEIPEISEEAQEIHFNIEFMEALGKAISLASHRDIKITRYVYVNKDIASTDLHRLYVMQDIAGDAKLFIDKKSYQAISKLRALKSKFFIDSNFLVAKHDDFTAFVRLPDNSFNEFPDYKQFLKDKIDGIWLSKDKFLDALEEIAPIYNNINSVKTLKMSAEGDVFVLKAIAPYGEEAICEIELPMLIDSFEISANYDYVKQAVKNVSGEEFVFKSMGEMKPIYITSLDFREIQAIMPLRD